MATLNEPRIREFLTNGTKTAKVAFVAGDGQPVVTPVWFIVEGEELVFNTGASTGKGKAFERDARIGLCVDLEEPPYAAVRIQGAVTVSEDSDELLRTAIEIARRYMGPELAEEFGARNAVPGELVVRVRPLKVEAEFDVTA